ncbi:MAG: hypothetical protein ACP6IS_00155 [Candidatus Asgardarchaeia archaeon]
MVSKDVLEVINEYINEVKTYFKNIPQETAESAEKRLRADIITKIKERKKKKEKQITRDDVKEIISEFGDPYQVALIYMALFNYVPKVPTWIITMEIMAGFMVSLVPSWYTFPVGFFLLLISIFSISKYRWAVELQKITIMISLIVYSIMVFLSSYALLSIAITSALVIPSLSDPLFYVIMGVPIAVSVLATWIIWKFVPTSIKAMPWLPPTLKYRKMSKKRK